MFSGNRNEIQQWRRRGLTMNPPSGVGFLPTDIAGLDLWLTADIEFLFTDAMSINPVTADGDIVGAWSDRSGNINVFTQATGSKKPEFKVAQLGGKDVVRFNGIDNLLTAPNFSSAFQGTIFVTYQLTAALIDFTTFFSTADETTPANNIFFNIRPYNNGANPNLVIQQLNADPQDQIKGSTIITAATSYLSVFRSNGSAYTMRLNGSDETLGIILGANNGDWFGDTPGRDNFVVGALKRNSGEALFVKGDIRQILVYDSNLIGSDLANVETFLAADVGIILP